MKTLGLLFFDWDIGNLQTIQNANNLFEGRQTSVSRYGLRTNRVNSTSEKNFTLTNKHSCGRYSRISNSARRARTTRYWEAIFRTQGQRLTITSHRRYLFVTLSLHHGHIRQPGCELRQQLYESHHPKALSLSLDNLPRSFFPLHHARNRGFRVC